MRREEELRDELRRPLQLRAHSAALTELEDLAVGAPGDHGLPRFHVEELRDER